MFISTKIWILKVISLQYCIGLFGSVLQSVWNFALVSFLTYTNSLFYGKYLFSLPRTQYDTERRNRARARLWYKKPLQESRVSTSSIYRLSMAHWAVRKSIAPRLRSDCIDLVPYLTLAESTRLPILLCKYFNLAGAPERTVRYLRRRSYGT